MAAQVPGGSHMRPDLAAAIPRFARLAAVSLNGQTWCPDHAQRTCLHIVRAVGHLAGVRDMTNHMMGIAQVAQRRPPEGGQVQFTDAIELVGKVIDTAGVALMVVGALLATVRAAVSGATRQPDVYRHYRQQLGRSILLGLELLVAADIIRTVAVTPSLRSVLVLALIVAIRTFLSFSLELEITGRWPWQKPEVASG